MIPATLDEVKPTSPPPGSRTGAGRRGALVLLGLCLAVAAGCGSRQVPDGASALPAVAPAPALPEPEPAPPTADWSVPERYRGEIVSRRVRHFPPRLLALTFDDGPDPQVTPQVLDTLARYGARATFFVLGVRARGQTELLQRMADEGHVVAIHGYEHLARASAQQAQEEIERTRHIIHEATGQEPTVYRPPYGITDNALTRRARELGYPVIMWTISSADTTGIPARVLADNVIYTPNPGEIVLMHDGNRRLHTAEALPLVLEELGAAGFTFVTVPELLRAWDAWLREGEQQAPTSPQGGSLGAGGELSGGS